MIRRVLAVCCVAAITCGCASAPQHEDSPRGRDHGPPPMRGGVFISPMGQPFRAGPGEPYPVVAWFAAADADHDGRLTEAEFVADAMAFFARIDTNHDGVIGSAENTAYETDIAPEILGGAFQGGAFQGGGEGGPRGRRGGHGGGPPPSLNMAQGGGGGPIGGGGGGDGPRRGGRGGGGGRPAGGGGLSNLLQGAAPFGLLGDPQPIRSADADQSQSVSIDEFRAAAKRRFARLDTNMDGVLLLSELPPTQAQKGRMR